MGVRVQSRRVHHKIHNLGRRAVARVKLIRRFRGPTFVLRVDIRHVPIDIPAIDKTPHQDHRPIAQRLRTRIPPLLLHSQHSWIIEPLALRRVEVVRVGARVEDADGSGAIVVLVGRVVGAAGIAWVGLRADDTAWTDCSVATKGDVGAIGEVHA
jgi:hypothetical protein